MAGQKKQSGGSSQPPKPEEAVPGESAVPPISDILSREELDSLSTLQLVDLIASKMPLRSSVLLDLVYLRDRITAIEEMNDQAREVIEKLDQAVEKLRSPAFRVGTFLAPLAQEQVHICLNGTDYVCKVDPAMPITSLQIGQRVLCNEAFAVIRSLGFDQHGPIVRVDETLSDGRLRIGQETGAMPLVVQRSALLQKEKLKSGMEVRLDANQRVALEVIGHGKRIDRTLDVVGEVPWSSIGGQTEAVKSIRDAIELPFLHRELYKRFDHRIPKGFLLHGPPGCGKTLLGKATAYNLRQQLKQQTGVDHPEFFLHIKGPELLNMWVGESERQVRDLFQQCRERAAEGYLAFLFMDEAESLLGVRHGGRFNSMSSTLVPMFCAEMDGLEALANVVVILASNRADLIDPAILRPGRIDRKIKVARPDKEGARAIYEIYLRDTLPLAEPGAELARRMTEAHFAKTEENAFLEVNYRSGRKETFYRGDFASGAIIAAVVERAKAGAIQRSITSGKESPITHEDLLAALRQEYAESSLFPSNDMTEDWLKLTDLDPENVARLTPIRPRKAQGYATQIV
jgi:proteasome-associated ATPase